MFDGVVKNFHEIVMLEKKKIITIDGPAGVGKSTISKMIAAAKGFIYLDTGAMYRGAGFFLEQQGVDIRDEEAVSKTLDLLDLQLVAAIDDQADVGVIVNGKDVSTFIRSPEMAMVASRVSAVFAVRHKLTQLQRDCGVQGGIVAEGRDMGTVVFPDAASKFFLDAQPEERARRRVEQMHNQGSNADFDEILAMIMERDKNDSEREIAPLKKATDALLIDTTRMTIAEVVKVILQKASF
jgi:cytidylate kinase